MLYRIVLALRHFFYDKGLKKVRHASVPTVCVGNITVGGTGKTPHTEMILGKLLESDNWAYRNIAVLSRGYKRRSKGFQLVPRDVSALLYGDEPAQMAHKFPSVTVAVDKNRIRGCKKLTEEEKADIIVLDDAYQYRKLAATVSIVLAFPHEEGRCSYPHQVPPVPGRMGKDAVAQTAGPEGRAAAVLHFGLLRGR